MGLFGGSAPTYSQPQLPNYSDEVIGGQVNSQLGATPQNLTSQALQGTGNSGAQVGNIGNQLNNENQTEGGGPGMGMAGAIQNKQQKNYNISQGGLQNAANLYGQQESFSRATQAANTVTQLSNLEMGVTNFTNAASIATQGARNAVVGGIFQGAGAIGGMAAAGGFGGGSNMPGVMPMNQNPYVMSGAAGNAVDSGSMSAGEGAGMGMVSQMAFAEDTSGQSAVGGLLQGFTGAYTQQKQLQQENQFRQAYLGLAQKNSDMENQRQQMGLLQNGMQTDSTGNVSYKPQQQDLVNLGNQAKMAEMQNTVNSNDPDATSQDSQKKRDFYTQALNMIQPGSGNKAIKNEMSAGDLSIYDPVIKSVMSSEAGMNRLSGLIGVKEDQLGFSKHKTAVNEVVNDSQTKNMLDQYNNLKNALTNYNASGGMPQEFNQLQTALRLNSQQGHSQTGVNERAEGYAKDWGISAQQAMQIMTGKMQNVEASSPEMVKAIKNIAAAELSNKQQQAAPMINKKANSFKSVYSKPGMQDYKNDFDNTVSNQYGQFDLDSNGKPVSNASGGGNQPPGGHTTVQQNGHTYTWNPSSGTYE